MKRYIVQLIEELELAQAKAQNMMQLVTLNNFDEEYTPFSESEFTGYRVSELIGMEEYLFPNTEYLDENEAFQLVNAIIRLWNSYGLNPLFMEGLPPKLKYSQLKNYLKEEVFPSEGEIVDVEVCDYLPHHCPNSAQCPVARCSDHYCKHKNSA